MLHVECKGCATSVYVDCVCPPGFVAGTGTHHGQCALSDLDARVVCPPGSDCCSEDHHHGNAANSCPGGHGSCPDPQTCALQAGAGGTGDCPGGHCHKDITDCGVCRPLTVTVLPGSTVLNLASLAVGE